MIKFFRKLWRNSHGAYGISLPKEVSNAVGASQGAMMAVTVVDGAIIITPTEAAPCQ